MGFMSPFSIVKTRVLQSNLLYDSLHSSFRLTYRIYLVRPTEFPGYGTRFPLERLVVPNKSDILRLPKWIFQNLIGLAINIQFSEEDASMI